MYKEIKDFTVPNDEDVLWRYMSFDKFVNILVTDTLFFTRADKFEDPFEGFMPQILKNHFKQIVRDDQSEELAEILIHLNEASRKYVMCNCWHKNKDESMAMWKQYQMPNSSIAIKTTMKNLKNSLSSEKDFYIGEIKYLNRDDYDLQYISSFSNTEFSIEQMLSIEQLDKKLIYIPLLYFPYFHKRSVFEHEYEVRVTVDISDYIEDALASLGNRTPKTFLEVEFPDICDTGLYFNVDVNALIDEVIVSPYAEPNFEDWVTQTAKEVACKYGFDFEVNRSTLLFDPAEDEII